MNAPESGYTDRAAMISAWIDCHGGIDDDTRPKVSPSGARMFAAGLAHARKQAAAQIEAMSNPDTMPDAPGMVRLRVEALLLGLAKQIRSEK